ncbi:MAG TPA: DUF2275 domain-containing protein [Blastocatellia bacterium]|nr:DUF2275 domain-containing protein [Blastocatellia bacterium]
MSRLDDELRFAFRRQEPPPDLVDRVMAEIVRQPVAKPGWRERFLSFLHQPRVRWVALGFATALLIVIGSLQYQNVQQSAGTDLMADVPTPLPEDKPAVIDPPAVSQPVASPAPPERRPKRLHRQTVAAPRLARDAKTEQERREGEAAKERLMLALHIASQTLNEAQKIMRED